MHETLVPIRQPHNEPMHSNLFNGRKKYIVSTIPSLLTTMDYLFTLTAAIQESFMTSTFCEVQIFTVDGETTLLTMTTTLSTSLVIQDMLVRKYLLCAESGRESLPTKLRCKPLIFTIGCMLYSSSR